MCVYLVKLVSFERQSSCDQAIDALLERLGNCTLNSCLAYSTSGCMSQHMCYCMSQRMCYWSLWQKCVLLKRLKVSIQNTGRIDKCADCLFLKPITISGSSFQTLTVVHDLPYTGAMTSSTTTSPDTTTGNLFSLCCMCLCVLLWLNANLKSMRYVCHVELYVSCVLFIVIICMWVLYNPIWFV